MSESFHKPQKLGVYLVSKEIPFKAFSLKVLRKGTILNVIKKENDNFHRYTYVVKIGKRKFNISHDFFERNGKSLQLKEQEI